jgi:protein TonB
MFESIPQPSRGSAVRRALMGLVSVAIHTAVLLALVIAPLVFLEARGDILLAFLIAPPLPPPPGPTLIHDGPKNRPIREGTIVPQRFQTPTAIPASIPAPEDDAPVLVTSLSPVTGPGIAAIGSGVPGGIFGASGPAFEKPLAPAPPPKPKQTAPQRISSGVQESKLVHRVDPVYPELARRARVSGVVILEVTVNEEGVVSDVRVLRGYPLLDEEAVRAVRQWRYSPTLLSGEPVPVIATVTVVFNLR